MNKKKYFIFPVILGLCVALIFVSLLNKYERTNKQISYSEAQQMIRAGEVSSVEMTEGSLDVVLHSEDITYRTKIPDITVFSEFMEKNNNSNIKFEIVKEENQFFVLLSTLLISILPYILIFTFAIYLFKKVLGFGSGKSLTETLTGESEKVSPVNTSGYSFNDVAGIDNERAEVEEVVSILKNPEKYLEIGAKIPKGVLLVGEPGTGKTLIAKAIAGEAGVKFYNCSGSNFDNTYVGVGASKVRKLFDEARKNAPAIIFIDEIDAIAQNRYSSRSYSEQTLNQLLSEMDGFEEKTNVIIIAATNHFEVLDPAITRPGRFDRIINIPLPDKKGRREILEVHARNKAFDENKDTNLTELAKKTSGMSGASLENILNEAAIIAVKNHKEVIDKDDLDEAFIKVVLGVSKEDKEVSKKEKFLVAIHEAGHAITSRISRPDLEILQVSIIPRGTAGGYTLFSDKDTNLLNKDDLYNEILVSLGGRAAEQIYFKSISVGASSDLQSATKLAHRMVYRYAMGSDTQMVKIFGEEAYNTKLEAKMFPAMETILNQAYKEALKIMNENPLLLASLANALMRNSTLNSSELEALFSKYNA